MEFHNRPQNSGLERGRGSEFSDEPGQKLVVGNLQQRLEFGEVVIAEIRDVGIGEGTEKQVDFPHAPVPGAEKRPPASRIKPLAGAR